MLFSSILKPDLLLVGKSVARSAQELLSQQENGGDPIIPFDEIVNATKTSFAALKSLQEGVWIKLD